MNGKERAKFLEQFNFGRAPPYKGTKCYNPGVPKINQLNYKAPKVRKVNK